ncbi:MAG: homocysteine S-methyltransferase family protein [Clostridia bacterium]|nr:homocysteine S-methyltransferase family protein [Clostridia bacterium]
MNVIELINDRLFYLDGGMGTLLQAAGLEAGEAPERWNLSHADAVTAIHRDYFNAGSHIINTNTFGANILHFSEEELQKIIAAAVKNAKTARDTSDGTQEKYIALDIGPTGRLLKPYGDLDFEDAVEIFAKTVRIGVSCGVDLVMIETMNDSYETKAALLAAKENCDLPVLVSNAYGEDGKLMTGADPEAMVALLEGMHADAIGVNCSFGPKQLMPVVKRLLQVASVPVFVKPNAGLPQSRDGKTVYDVLPEDFSDDVAAMIEMGARGVGGCCGTTPEYIRAVTERTHGMTALPITPKKRTVVSSYTHAVDFANQPILIGERINPTGKKRFKQALVENDMDYILQEGIRQEECGVHILDVNVGLPEIDEKAMLCRATCELQAVIDLPLQLDTADFSAMEAAMRRYNGKALINSVNGKAESMQAIFPLVQKYGGVVIALTLDECGIPDTAQGRFAIAERILKTAAEYGIAKEDLVFDTLAMTVSADQSSAMVTLESLRLIRENLGCYTSLGVSNVSFGLPSREAVNSVFFASALENGLSAAIMNPYSLEMRKVYYAYRCLHGLDENCADYIAFSATCPQTQSTVTVPTTAATADTDTASSLQKAILSGRTASAGALTETLLAGGTDPMEIVQNEIIPALDRVGKGFEEKTVYLPQLLMSAEAAKLAFEKIKAQMQTSQSASDKKMTIVLATVKGDIHDIGKNIVRLLLENYGFTVIDLGKDVAPEAILEAAVQSGAPLVGLSALMTTTVPSMEETIKLLRSALPACRVMVGGAVMNEDYAARIGADRYCKDAMEAVRYAESL